MRKPQVACRKPIPARCESTLLKTQDLSWWRFAGELRRWDKK